MGALCPAMPIGYACWDWDWDWGLGLGLGLGLGSDANQPSESEQHLTGAWRRTGAVCAERTGPPVYRAWLVTVAIRCNLALTVRELWG